MMATLPTSRSRLPDGSQFVYHPRANGGFSVGTQGTDFFRGGDLVNGLTGVLHCSLPWLGADTWRIRPTNATPAAFTVANPRPATPPAVGGAIKAVSMNLLNYFTSIDTTSSSSAGPCGPSGTLDCRGADSVAELNRQRERASIAICSLNADVYAFMELENTTASGTINDLLGSRERTLRRRQPLCICEYRGNPRNRRHSGCAHLSLCHTVARRRAAGQTSIRPIIVRPRPKPSTLSTQPIQHLASALP